METDAPSLGDQIARLHGSMRAQEKCAWIPAPIHTLIMAALARIFGRLEQMLRLWQAGILPTPQPRTSSNRDSARPSVPSHHAGAARKRASPPAFPSPAVILRRAKDPRFLRRAPGPRQLRHGPIAVMERMPSPTRPRATHHPPGFAKTHHQDSE